MKLIEIIKLRYRAYKYRTKHDEGGIAYLNSAIQPGQTVLDIGAHKGGYLYFMLQRVGKQGKIFAFEPQSALYGYLTKMKRMCRWDNVTLEHLALSDTETVVTLYIPTHKTPKSSSPGATIVPNQENAVSFTTETIPTQTLDAYCRVHHLRPDFLKIDVEGNELQIFQGGINTLKNCKPRILVEIEARHIGRDKVLETFAFLQALGYKGYVIQGLHRLPLSDFDFDKHQNVADKRGYCNNFVFE